MPFHTVLVDNIPSGELYQHFRLLLLRDIQYATAGHWKFDSERKNILMIFDKDVNLFADAVNRQLKIYRDMLRQPEGKYVTVKVLE